MERHILETQLVPLFSTLSGKQHFVPLFEVWMALLVAFLHILGAGGRCVSAVLCVPFEAYSSCIWAPCAWLTTLTRRSTAPEWGFYACIVSSMPTLKPPFIHTCTVAPNTALIVIISFAAFCCVSDTLYCDFPPRSGKFHNTGIILGQVSRTNSHTSTYTCLERPLMVELQWLAVPLLATGQHI